MKHFVKLSNSYHHYSLKEPFFQQTNQNNPYIVHYNTLGIKVFSFLSEPTTKKLQKNLIFLKKDLKRPKYEAIMFQNLIGKFTPTIY